MALTADNSVDFGDIIDKILKFIPRERRTYLFSATMSQKVESLQRASLKDPVKLHISKSKYQTVYVALRSLFPSHLRLSSLSPAYADP